MASEDEPKKGSKSMPRRNAVELARILNDVIEERYPDGATRPGSVALAKEIGISQPALSEARNGNGCGVPVLFKLRQWTGLTLDQLVGFAPILKNQEDILRAFDAIVSARASQPSPAPTPGSLPVADVAKPRQLKKRP